MSRFVNFHTVTRDAVLSRVVPGLLIFLGFSALFKVSYANSALGALALLALVDYPNNVRALAGTAYLRLTCAFLAYVVGWALWMVFVQNLSGAYVIDIMSDYITFGFLPVLVVGYWGYRYRGSIFPAILALPLGFVSRIVDRWDAENGMTVLTGAVRATFGESSASFGAWGVIVCFCGLFAVHYAIQNFSDKKKLAYLTSAVGVVYIFFGIACVFYAQTRALWLIAAVLVPIYCLVLAYLHFSRKLLIVSLGLLAGAAFFVGRFSGGITQVMASRWESAKGGLEALLTGNLYNTGYSSIDIRLRMFSEAWSAWLEKPIFGWGLGTDARLVAASGDPVLVAEGFTHFHNQWLWILVETGAIGFFFFVMALALPLFYSMRCWADDRKSAPVSLFAGMTIVALSVACLSDQQLTSYRGPFVVALIAGAIFSHRLSYLTCKASSRERRDVHVSGYAGATHRGD